MAELPAFLKRAQPTSGASTNAAGQQGGQPSAPYGGQNGGQGGYPQQPRPFTPPTVQPSQPVHAAPVAQGFAPRPPVSYAPAAPQAAMGTAVAEPPRQDASIREVFLSPRVIDREAFNDYASQLKQLIEHSAGHAEALKAAAAAAHTAQHQMQQAAVQNQPRLEAAAKALLAFDGKVKLAEQTIAEAERVGRELLARHQHAMDVLDNRIAELADRAEQAANNAERRAAEAETQATLKISEMQARLEAMGRDIDQRLDAKLTEIQHRSELAANDAVALAEQANERVEQAKKSVVEVCREIEQAGAETAGRFRGELEAGSNRLAALITESKFILDPTPITDESKGRFNIASLADLVQRAEKIGDDASFATRQLEAVREQAEMARNMLGDSVNDAAGSIDQLSIASEQLKTALAGTVELAAKTERSIRAKADEMTAALRVPLVEAESMADEMRMNLATSIEQVSTAQAAAAKVSAETASVLSKLTHLVEDLKPWQGLLANHQKGTMPEPIEQIVRQFRGELTRDLSQIAAGMHQITSKAVQLAESLQPDRR